jgi:hypothetical protein
MYYSNIWSYYHASGSDFAEIGPLKCGPRDRVCLGLNLGGDGSLDLFVDQNVFVWTSPYKILGVTYGLLVDVPFGIADASGAGSLEPILSLNRGRSRCHRYRIPEPPRRAASPTCTWSR